MITPMIDLLRKAKQGGFAVPAPNIFSLCNMETIFEVAHELKTPLIMGVPGSRDLEAVGWLGKFYEKRYPDARVAINLDHGGPFEQIITAIHAGFSSVMIDRSSEDFETNVRESAEIVKIAHSVGITVEAELGHVGKADEDTDDERMANLTNKDQALEFVERTGVDCLAVAVGTSHGAYKNFNPYIDFQLLGELSGMLTIPLVLHGGSGTGDENLSKAVRTGIQKVNIATDLNYAGTDGMTAWLDANKPGLSKKRSDIPGAEKAMKAAYRKMLIHYVGVFGSEGKA